MNSDASIDKPGLTVVQGRMLIFLAAVLWSLGGAFNKILTKNTVFQLGDPPVHGIFVACFRALFASLVMIPTVSLKEVRLRPILVVMVVVFALMNVTYVLAMSMGTAANAILLQYTAPLWMYIASIWWLGEKADKRGGEIGRAHV